MNTMTMVAIAIGLLAVVGVIVFFVLRNPSVDEDLLDGKQKDAASDDDDDDDDETPAEDGGDPEDMADENDVMSVNSIVFFGSPGCPGCRHFLPRFRRSARRTRYPFRYMNVGKIKNREFLGRNNIRRIPHIVAIKDGKIAGVYDGPRTTGGLRRFARKMRGRNKD